MAAVAVRVNGKWGRRWSKAFWAPSPRSTNDIIEKRNGSFLTLSFSQP